MKKIIKKLFPRKYIAFAHGVLSWVSALWYQFPSRRMVVVGVTGTNGKSTTVHMIGELLRILGQTVGYTSTVEFRVGEKHWINNQKMTMLGRWQLQKLLADMVRVGCGVAVVETSSEGLAQNRHWGIDYDVALCTNLTPEHIESHGSFEKYRQAKGKLFESLVRSVAKKGLGLVVPKTSIVNIDDVMTHSYSEYWAEKKAGFGTGVVRDGAPLIESTIGTAEELHPQKSGFVVEGVRFEIPFEGKHNVANALAAIAVCRTMGYPLGDISKAFTSVPAVPGRLEVIEATRGFTILIDYAPEPASLAALYETVDELYRSTHQRIIHVLGSCGGGRDRARRPVLGAMAGRNADVVVVTNEDPYDEDPQEIIDVVFQGALSVGKKEDENVFRVLDRREAIAKAFSLAREGDLVILSGKGAEQAIAGPNGTYTPWNEREVALTLLKTFS